MMVMATEGVQLWVAGVALGVIGYFINEKLKTIKEDTTDCRKEVKSLTDQLNKLFRSHDKLTGTLHGKGCLDSHEFPCYRGGRDEESTPR